jgi:hypothetical protein
MTTDDKCASALSSAAPEEVQAHRNALGDMLQNLSSKGLDVNTIAQKVGISSTDINELTHDDIISLTRYVATNHPEILQGAANKFPQAQGLISMVTANSGIMGAIGGLFGGAK